MHWCPSNVSLFYLLFVAPITRASSSKEKPLPLCEVLTVRCPQLHILFNAGISPRVFFAHCSAFRLQVSSKQMADAHFNVPCISFGIQTQEQPELNQNIVSAEQHGSSKRLAMVNVCRSRVSNMFTRAITGLSSVVNLMFSGCTATNMPCYRAPRLMHWASRC